MVTVQLPSFTERREVAVCEDLEDEAHLGIDLGKKNLAKWLLDSSYGSGTVRVTR